MIKIHEIEEIQRALCARAGTIFAPIDWTLNVGISRDFYQETVPINGLRHPSENGTCGWYLWLGGDLPTNDPEFFQPVHAYHLIKEKPQILNYLGLPPGFRFLIDNQNYEEVWFDEKLLRPSND